MSVRSAKRICTYDPDRSRSRGISCHLYYRTTLIYAVELIDRRKTDIPFDAIARPKPGNLKDDRSFYSSANSAARVRMDFQVIRSRRHLRTARKSKLTASNTTVYNIENLAFNERPRFLEAHTHQNYVT